MEVMYNEPNISNPNTLTVDDLIKVAAMVNEVLDKLPYLDSLALDESYVGGSHAWAVDEVLNGPCANHNSRAKSIVRSILLTNHDILTNANYDI